MKKINFGIDCDPFCRNQQVFIDKVNTEIIADPERAAVCVSKCFGAWEFVATISEEERTKIWNLMNEYYNDSMCRGAYCEDPWENNNQ